MIFSGIRGRQRTSVLAVAVGLAGLFAVWYIVGRVSPAPKHTLRIGFEENPPVQVRAAGELSGLSVETVNEAARRAGIRLEWIETGTSSEEALRRSLVDLWPLMVNLPHRRKYIYFARPWMHSRYALLLREGTPAPDRDFQGRIAVFKLPLHVGLLHQQFPKAQALEIPESHGVLTQVCAGAAPAGFLEARVAQTELREGYLECASSKLRLQTIPDLRVEAGVASTFEAAGAADRIQHEIAGMFRDGTLAVLIARYSYFGLEDTWASYEQLKTEERWKWFTWLTGGLILAAGAPLWLANSLRQRKRVEAALRESERRFRMLANTAPVMIVESGPDGNATFFNKPWLDFTGRTAEQELGYGWIEDLHPDDRDRVRGEYAASLAGRGSCRLEYRLRRADGQYRYMTCSGVPRCEPGGEFVGYVATCLDLTEIRQAQEEASERQKLESLGVLAGGIAHDFNNLLGGALAYTELAQSKLGDGNSPDEELRHIREVASRGSEIVRQLMIFAGQERGTLEFLDVSSLVSEMLELLRVSISKHAVLKTELGAGLPPVRGNASQIRQLVMNLITNASEAIGDRDGVIRVLTEVVLVGSEGTPPGAANLRAGDYLRLEVSDNGCGMTPETQRKAFDPFFSTKFVGRGMGLAMVQRIVRELEGAVHVVSSPGNGTSMQILLPCAVAPASVNEVRVDADPHPAASPAPRRTILIVEDEQALLYAISKLLERRGFSVIQASNGTAALELIRKHQDRIDAMLLDATLPGASSREVLDEAERLRPELVAVLTSAYSRDTVAASFAGLTIADFVRKPFQIGDLVTLLGDRLSARCRAMPSGQER